MKKKIIKTKKKAKLKQGFGIKLSAKKRLKPSIKLPEDPNPGMMPTRITGVLLPLKQNPQKHIWRILECSGTQTVFTLSKGETRIIARLIRSFKACREVRVSVKNGRLMSLTFNEYGDGKIT